MFPQNQIFYRNYSIHKNHSHLLSFFTHLMKRKKSFMYFVYYVKIETGNIFLVTNSIIHIQNKPDDLLEEWRISFLQFLILTTTLVTYIIVPFHIICLSSRKIKFLSPAQKQRILYQLNTKNRPPFPKGGLVKAHVKKSFVVKVQKPDAGFHPCLFIDCRYIRAVSFSVLRCRSIY